MSTYESSYKSLLQGVSQQLSRERLPGQVGAQLNMLSDAVTNIRRRPGAEYKFNVSMPGSTHANTKAWFVDISGTKLHVILNCATGQIRLLNPNFVAVATLEAGAYLTTAVPENIRAATLGDELFLLNTAVLPTKVAPTGTTPPYRQGYFYIAAGAFSKQYSVTIGTSVGSQTVSYVTPTGAAAGDAALATPEYIASQLAAAINASAIGVSVARTDAYVYITGSSLTACVINSGTGSAYIQTSKDCYTTATGNLPSHLPGGAHGMIMRVGDMRTPQYYQYSGVTTAWLECGQYGSAAGLANMPVSVSKVGSTWTLLSAAYEGRFAGDDISNEDPKFLSSGISGMGVFQGRLVLLSGSFVRMSASNKPRRFYRSTITSVLNSDSIEISASANSSAAYQYAVPFQRDLLLFSEQYQALVPSSNAAITPNTATIVLTSTHATDMTCPPVTLGRTLMYPTPVSADFFGFLEMVPSQYSDAQYISSTATPHLPKYMPGRCRFGVASGVDGIVMFGPSNDPYSLVVHEYAWDGDTKVQKAWHTWTFKYRIASAYFADNQIVVLFCEGGTVVGCTIDPRIGLLTPQAQTRPFLDLYYTTTITDHVVTIPGWMLALDPAAASKVTIANISGDLAGEKVGFTVTDTTHLKTVRSYPSGSVAVGFGYKSAFSPTEPLVKDSNDVVISSAKSTLLRYNITTTNSMEYKVQIYDRNTTSPEAEDVGVLYWSSSELALGKARVAKASSAIVPCRTNTDSTSIAIYTEGTGELNLVALEYVLKYNTKIRRR